MPFEPGSIAAGAILGAGLASLNRWWQYSRESWNSRVSTFCDLANDAADAASTYWLAEVDSSLLAGGPSKELNEARAVLVKHECVIIGIQAQLDGLYGSFDHRLSFRDRPNLEAMLRELSGALTGGQFQGRDRRFDPERARAAHVLASELISAVRRAFDRAITLRGLIEHLAQWPHKRERQETP